MENSALEKRDSSRGGTNETDSNRSDNSRRTGATINEGSNPSGSARRILRLLGHRVALQPLRRNKSDSGLIHYAMTHMDDRRQWRVINMSEKVFKLGLFVNGDHVVTQGLVEAEHEFSDGIIIADAKWVVGVVGVSNP